MAVDPMQMMGGGGMPPLPPDMMGAPAPAGMPGADPMMAGAPAGGLPGMPSLDPNVVAQLLAPVAQIQAQDVDMLKGAQQQTLMDVFMGMLANVPNPDGYAAQAAPTGTSAPDLSLPPSDDLAVQ